MGEGGEAVKNEGDADCVGPVVDKGTGNGGGGGGKKRRGLAVATGG